MQTANFMAASFQPTSSAAALYAAPLLQFPPSAAVPASAAAPLQCPLPFKMPRKAYTCNVCGLPVMTEGHTQFFGQRYCPSTPGIASKEEWLRVKRAERDAKKASPAAVAQPIEPLLEPSPSSAT